MFLVLFLAIATSVLGCCFTVALTLLTHTYEFIAVSIALTLVNIAFIIVFIINWKNWIKADKDYPTKPIIKTKKEVHEENQKNDHLYIDEVMKMLEGKKLFPLLDISPEGLRVLHQNPNTKDVFTIIPELIIPRDTPGSSYWKKSLAEESEKADDFIESHKNEIVLEDMKIDVKA